MKQKMISRLLLLFVIAGLASVARAEIAKPKMFNVKTYGGIGVGATLNTEALQKTIDACHAAGGGVVWVPAGDFVIGTVHLKSHVTLSLDCGASLLGSQDWTDYPTDKLRRAREGQSECLLYAEDATNIRLEGLGVIDGRGTPEAFPKRRARSGRDSRPRLLRFESCENVTFSGLTYKRPAFWGLHLVDCKNLHFDAVTVRFLNNGSNNDGLDLAKWKKQAVNYNDCSDDSAETDVTAGGFGRSLIGGHLLSSFYADSIGWRFHSPSTAHLRTNRKSNARPERRRLVAFSC